MEHKEWLDLFDDAYWKFFFALSIGAMLLLLLWFRDFKLLFFNIVISLPIVRNIYRRKVEKILQEIYNSLHGKNHVLHQTSLPGIGLSKEEVLTKMKEYQFAESISWDKGYVSGAVYSNDPKLTELLTEAFSRFLWSNPLHANIFPDVRRMEAEVVRMCANMFHGDDNSCGTTTSGGTESIMLACLAYRELAYERDIEYPTIIVPESAHPSFDKAAHYFCLNIIHTPVDKVTGKADVGKMRRAIDSSTCLLVGSAPSFPHGAIDPIEEISNLGQKYGIPVHVDCCLGGFLLPFMDKAGYPITPVDFRLPGVTSISCDAHKYGFAAKGISIVLYRNREYRARQFFIQPNWSGGLYASPTFAGSRSGAAVAVCWASMMYHGENGYVEATRRIVKTTRFIAEELARIPGIHMVGTHEVSVVAFTSKVFNIHILGHRLSNMPDGHTWHLNHLQFPSALHLCVTDQHTTPGRAESFIQDVKQVAMELYEHPDTTAEGVVAMYGTSQLIPKRSIISRFAVGYMDACYATPTPNKAEST